MVAYDDTEQTTKVRNLFNTATLLNTRCDLALGITRTDTIA